MRDIDIRILDRMTISGACLVVFTSLLYNSVNYVRRYLSRPDIKTKSIDVIIARYNEPLDWIPQMLEILPHANIFVYNKGNDDIDLITSASNVTIKKLENIGREGETYARHIFENYDRLADMNIFLQADPFPHAPHLMTSLSQIKYLPYQPLSLKYLGEVPPTCLLQHEDHSQITREQLISSYTLNSIEFHDEGTVLFYNAYLKYHALLPGTNVMRHFMNSIGASHLIASDAKILKFAYAALFATSADAIRQHPSSVYKRLQERVSEDSSIGYILERAWGLLFRGSPISSKSRFQSE